MDYFTRYVARVTRDGTTNQERVQKFVQKEYENFVKQSPTKQTVTINDRKIICSIQSHRFRDEENLKFLVTKHTNQFPLGSLVYMENQDIWMLLRHEPHPFDGDNRYVIIQCKHIVKWVDRYGVENESPCCLIGDMGNRIKENFRTWNNMITPQPNKYLEIIMPRHIIARKTRIAIDGEAWYLVDFDRVTIPGIIYMSFTESAIDVFDDDIENDVANSSNIGMIDIRAASTTLTVAPNVATALNVHAFNRGNIMPDEQLTFQYDNTYIDIADGTIVVTEPGVHTIYVTLTEQPRISLDMTIICSNDITSTPYSIRGNSSLRWGRSGLYNISRFVNGEEEIAIHIPLLLEPTTLATLEKRDDSYFLMANENNETGTIVLTAVLPDNTVLTKEVNIVALWS